MPTIFNLSDLDLSKTYTYTEYLQWRFAERVELVKGFIKKMSPAPSRPHQTISMNLSRIVGNLFHRKPCNVFVAPFDVRLPVPHKLKESTVVQPDLCIICDDNKLDDKGCQGAPDLVIEITSPTSSHYDLTTKFEIYQEAGVLEYWIVDITDRMILVYTLQNGKYIGLQPFTEGKIIESPLFSDLKIEVTEIFYKVTPTPLT